MTTDDDISVAYATQAAQAQLTDGRRPAWRYMSVVLTRMWSNPEPASTPKKAEPVDVDAATQRQFFNPALGRLRGRFYDPRWQDVKKARQAAEAAKPAAAPRVTPAPRRP